MVVHPVERLSSKLQIRRQPRVLRLFSAFVNISTALITFENIYLTHALEGSFPEQ